MINAIRKFIVVLSTLTIIIMPASPVQGKCSWASALLIMWIAANVLFYNYNKLED